MVTASNSTSITASWELPPADSRNGIITGFKLFYRQKHSGNQSKLLNISNASIRAETVRELMKFTEYEFQLLAYTSVGDGPNSSVQFAKTMEDAPSKPPSGFIVNARTSSSVTASWQLPPADSRNGIIRGFKLFINRKESGDKPDVQFIDVSKTSVYTKTVTGLQESTEYELQVLAYTSAGDGPQSSVQFVKTKEHVPSSDPVIVKGQDGTKAEDAHTIRVVWEEIPEKDQNGIITGYTVFYNETGQPQYFSKNATASQTSALIGGLKPFTKYCIKVAGYTKVGRSPLTDPCYEVETQQKVPSSDPVIVKGQDGTKAEDAHTIRVVWEEIPERDQNGIITGYTVFYIETGQPQYFSKNAPASQTSVLIGGLKPFTKYCIKVAGYTKVGRSPLKDPCYEVETLQKGPSHPRDVMVQAKSSTSILVSWKEPAFQNGIITNYIIYYGQQEHDQKTEARVTGSTFERLLTDLRKFTTYYIKVRGNTTELGNASRLLNATTFEDLPSNAPSGIMVTASSSTSITASWQLPPADSRNGIITGFKLFYRQKHSGNQSTALNISNASIRAETVRELMKFTEYEFQLLAYTSVGDGPKSSVQFARTMEDAPSKPPSGFIVNVSTSSSVTASWQLPPADSRNGIIRGFKLFINRKGSGDKPDVQLIDVSETSLYTKTVTGLQESTEYELQVLAYTSVGDGPKSVVNFVKTKEVGKNPPSGLEELSVTIPVWYN
ncbi:protein sidekick-2-like isoform X2 [Montipora capricornis]|uniref:protein sidekick-2-like isoform X2 n=1 Tax=Montipora capricornis TaxID=246305 RepID=UPI0035F103F9